jgi:hypothetical protein
MGRSNLRIAEVRGERGRHILRLIDYLQATLREHLYGHQAMFDRDDPGDVITSGRGLATPGQDSAHKRRSRTGTASSEIHDLQARPTGRLTRNRNQVTDFERCGASRGEREHTAGHEGMLPERTRDEPDSGM